MGAGHSLLALGAFILVTSILRSFYGSVNTIGDDIMSGQDGILATSIATSYVEIANGLAFDEITDSTNIAIANPSALSDRLGKDAMEDSISSFNDFDDFNGYSEEKEAGGSHRRYMTSFAVHYVNPDDLEQVVTTKTFLKRMDLKTWRTYPASLGEAVDTLRTSVVMGYFHFN